MPSRMYLLTSSASTNSAMAATPTMSMPPESPSRKRGKTKAAKTKADPVSCCRKTSTAGMPMMASATTLVRIWPQSTLMALMYLAKASEVANLANSDGCRRKAPRSIHDLPPCEVMAMKSVSTSSTMTTP